MNPLMATWLLNNIQYPTTPNHRASVPGPAPGFFRASAPLFSHTRTSRSGNRWHQTLRSLADST